jgi:hypothetical protein
MHGKLARATIFLLQAVFNLNYLQPGAGDDAALHELFY